MGLWRDFLRLLGLSGDARVHISAPGIDVVITGEPEQVRALLGVVKYELERSARWRDRLSHPIGAGGADAPARRGGGGRSNQYVQPTELDEMDSPYALPDPLVMPVEDTTGERERPSSGVIVERTKSENGAKGTAPVPPRYVAEPATLVPDVYETRDDPQGPTGPSVKAVSRMDARPMLARNESPPQEVKSTRVDSSVRPKTPEDEEREVTAVGANPSGPVAAPSSASAPDAPAILRSSSPFVTDGGPTLTPSVSDSGAQVVRRDVRNTDPDADETKETTRSES